MIWDTFQKIKILGMPFKKGVSQLNYYVIVRVFSRNSSNALSKAKLLFPKCPNIPKGWGVKKVF